jgi:type II secretory pathway pseudopilin PulG
MVRQPQHSMRGQRSRQRELANGRDRGDTLIEIILTVVIVAVAISALISSLATAGAASTAQRQSVVADAILRNYAEAAKHAARNCVVGEKYAVDFAVPEGYDLRVEPDTATCPEPTETLLVEIGVTTPTKYVQTMQFRVRTP